MPSVSWYIFENEREAEKNKRERRNEAHVRVYRGRTNRREGEEEAGIAHITAEKEEEGKEEEKKSQDVYLKNELLGSKKGPRRRKERLKRKVKRPPKKKGLGWGRA